MTTLRFSRTSIFVMGMTLLFTVYFSICFFIYSHSLYTEGVLVLKEPATLYNDGNVSMTLFYYVNMKEYNVPVETALTKANQRVTVRYYPNCPEKGKIYNRADFWFLNMLWLTLPMMLWGAFILSFMEPSGKVVLQSTTKKRLKKEDIKKTI